MLRGDIAKDDSGACTVFTEQGSSASQMTAAKVMDVLARLRRCAGQPADAASAHTQAKMEDAPKWLRVPKSECPDLWIRLPWASIDLVVPLERNLSVTRLLASLWERQLKEVLLELGWEKLPNWGCPIVHSKQGLVLPVCVDDIRVVGRQQNVAPMWKKLMKIVDLGEPTSFLDHVHLGCAQRECKPNEIFIEQLVIIQTRI